MPLPYLWPTKLLLIFHGIYVLRKTPLRSQATFLSILNCHMILQLVCLNKAVITFTKICNMWLVHTNLNVGIDTLANYLWSTCMCICTHHMMQQWPQNGVTDEDELFQSVTSATLEILGDGSQPTMVQTSLSYPLSLSLSLSQLTYSITHSLTHPLTHSLTHSHRQFFVQSQHNHCLHN